MHDHKAIADVGCTSSYAICPLVMISPRDIPDHHPGITKDLLDDFDQARVCRDGRETYLTLRCVLSHTTARTTHTTMFVHRKQDMH